MDKVGSSKQTPVKKVLKRLQKVKLRYWIILACLIFLITIAIAAAHARFLLYDELLVQTNPQNPTYHFSSGQQATLNISLHHENFASCRSECSIRVRDLGNNEIIHEERIRLQRIGDWEHSFNISIAQSSAGQVHYLYEATCNNINTLICPSEGHFRYSSSLITIVHSLSDEDQAYKNEIWSLLNSTLHSFNELQQMHQQNEQLLARLNIEQTIIARQHASIGNKMNRLQVEVTDTHQLWGDEQFKMIDIDHLSSLSNDAFTALFEAANIHHDITASIIATNQWRTTFSQIIERFPEIGEQVSWYAQVTPATQNIREALQNLTVNLETQYNYHTLTTITSAQHINQITQLEQEFTSWSHNHKVRTNNTQGLFVYYDYLLQTASTPSCTMAATMASSISSHNKEIADISQNLTPQTIANIQSNTLVQHTAAYNAVQQKNLSVALLPIANLLNTTPINETSLFTIDPTALTAWQSTWCLGNTPAPSFVFPSLPQLPLIDESIPEVTLSSLVAQQHEPQCCFNGECKACCDQGCDKPIPVLFIHGHGINEANTPEYSMQSLTTLQRAMQRDGFLNAGQFDLATPSDRVPPGIWGRSGAPVTIRGSYYYITYFGGVGVQRSQNIENYALRLHELIDVVRERTGSDQVHIVAHSMGGLVAREYIGIFGDDKVATLVTVNTPHQGLTPNIQRWCRLLGAKTECNDMAEGSVFMQRLAQRQFPADKTYVIRSIGCPMDGTTGDGVVTNQSGYLEGAHNFVIEGTCADRFGTELHTLVLSPLAYPQFYELLLEILRR